MVEGGGKEAVYRGKRVGSCSNNARRERGVWLREVRVDHASCSGGCQCLGGAGGRDGREARGGIGWVGMSMSVDGWLYGVDWRDRSGNGRGRREEKVRWDLGVSGVDV